MSESTDRLPPEVAERMLEEASGVAAGASDGETVDAGGVAAEEPEPGTVADTGQPAGTADARAAGVIDSEDESLR